MRTRPRDRHPSTPLPRSLAASISEGKPFATAEALAAGLVTRHGLRTGFRSALPGVSVAKGSTLTRWDRVRAVRLWAPSDAVIGGWAAAYLHGEHWFSTDNDRGAVDVFTASDPRVPSGVRVRSLRRPIADPDVCEIIGIRITTPARTAVDVARWTTGTDRRICMIDSLCYASGISLDAVAKAAARMSGQHGASKVIRLLESCDDQAHSPQESLLRLRIERSPLPRPTSQYEIFATSGERITTADLAYPADKIAIFYDGKHHGDPEQWRRDIRITARLVDLGWQVVRVTKGMSADEVLHHITNAFARARGRRAA